MEKTYQSIYPSEPLLRSGDIGKHDRAQRRLIELIARGDGADQMADVGPSSKGEVEAVAESQLILIRHRLRQHDRIGLTQERDKSRFPG